MSDSYIRILRGNKDFSMFKKDLFHTWDSFLLYSSYVLWHPALFLPEQPGSI
ncbi:MAG: hypothetical protein WDO71_13885 [Bacteroidota bacterium]